MLKAATVFDGLELAPLRKRRVLKILGLGYDPEAVLTDHQCLIIWTAVLLQDEKICDTDAMDMVLEHLDTALTGDAGRAKEIQLVFANNTLCSWTGAEGWLHVLSGVYPAATREPIIKSTAYNLSNLFRVNYRGCLDKEQINANRTQREQDASSKS